MGHFHQQTQYRKSQLHNFSLGHVFFLLAKTQFPVKCDVTIWRTKCKGKCYVCFCLSFNLVVCVLFCYCFAFCAWIFYLVCLIQGWLNLRLCTRFFGWAILLGQPMRHTKKRVRNTKVHIRSRSSLEISLFVLYFLNRTCRLHF